MAEVIERVSEERSHYEVSRSKGIRQISLRDDSLQELCANAADDVLEYGRVVTASEEVGWIEAIGFTDMQNILEQLHSKRAVEATFVE